MKRSTIEYILGFVFMAIGIYCLYRFFDANQAVSIMIFGFALFAMSESNLRYNFGD